MWRVSTAISRTIPNGCIWVLVPRDNRAAREEILETEESPFNVQGIELIDPMVVSPRISVQGGMFTLHGDPWTPLDAFEDDDLTDIDFDVSMLIGYQILGHHKPLRLKELNDLGIGRRTLFPDLDGLTRGLVNDEVLRKHAPELDMNIRERTPTKDKRVTWPY
jgi:hypothetical protein